jgi:DNA-binding transcriptional ArsR family regulator
MSEDVIVLQPGDERAQKIAKAISSQTANDILHLLGDGSKSATDITEVLSLPMGTVKYHIDNLLEAGLIEISETRYSVKGREVKIYQLRDQLLIVAPRVKNIRSLLLKYASLFVIVIFATLMIPVLMPLFQPEVILPMADGSGSTLGSGAAPAVLPTPVPTAVPTAVSVAEKSMGIMAEPGAYDASRAPSLSYQVPGFTPADIALAFFLGGVLVLLILVIYEAWLLRKKA